MSDYSQSQRERLNYLEFRVYFTGQISRADLITRFGISEAAATRDLAIYRKEVPNNLDFDTVAKLYRISESFKSHYLNGIDPGLLLRALVHGVGNDFEAKPEAMVPCELPGRQHAPPADVLAAVSRAICQSKVLRIEYFSGTGNHGSREVVPLSLAGTGLKWIVRAYCRRKGIFCDFVLNRIRSAEVLLDSVPADEEMKEFDDEWNRMLKLELIPHPEAKSESRAMTELEFRMTEGVYLLRVRAALAGYILRLWSVDCSTDQSLKRLPLALRNLLSLHDVDSAKLAPGFERPTDMSSTAQVEKDGDL